MASAEGRRARAEQQRPAANQEGTGRRILAEADLQLGESAEHQAVSSVRHRKVGLIGVASLVGSAEGRGARGEEGCAVGMVPCGLYGPSDPEQVLVRYLEAVPRTCVVGRAAQRALPGSRGRPGLARKS